MVELRSLVWGDDAGWYRPHTLRLNGTAARILFQAPGVVRRSLHCQDNDGLGPKMLSFPSSYAGDGATAGQISLSLDHPDIPELEVAAT